MALWGTAEKLLEKRITIWYSHMALTAVAEARPDDNNMFDKVKVRTMVTLSNCDVC